MNVIITKPIEGYEDSYSVDYDGNVHSELRGGRKMCPAPDSRGYPQVELASPAGSKKHLVHRLVCAAFHGPAPEGRPQVNHIDGNKANNAASNLEWCSVSENLKHAFKLGARSNHGDKNPRSKLKLEQVQAIRERLKNGVARRLLALEYAVSVPCIAQIATGERWQHVT